MTAPWLCLPLLAALAATAAEADPAPAAPSAGEPTAAAAPAPEAPASPPPASAEPSPEPQALPVAPDAAPVVAGPAGSEDLITAMFELESQLDQMVVSGTKTEQRVTQTPAVISVITADEIHARGYASLAEALRTVPGFYDVYDLATHNVGIRGINGGARASGSVLKLMVDGQAVPYRPSTGNFFGEELIPMQAIERIEVIRGPGSALYGANAFLGVINVITRTGAAAEGVRLTGSGGFVREHLSGSGSLMLAAGTERAEVMVAASAAGLNRSGLSLPQSSPLLQRGGEDPGTSASDMSRPKSLFAKAAYGTLERGRISALASIQSLEAGGEFQDFAPLTHGTRLAMVNQTYRLAYDHELKHLALRLSGGYFHSAPSSRERLDLGAEGSVLRRDVEAHGFELAAEARIRPLDALTVTVGADFVREDHLLQSYDKVLTEDLLGPDGSVLRSKGTIVAGDGKGRRAEFDNVGAMLQALLQATDAVGLTGGVRLDHNSIYGTHFSPRLAGVFAPAESPFNLKLLYGSSFKAPSAEQLYTRPMLPFDVRGNEHLSVQKAHTGELAGGWRFGGWGELSGSLFVTKVTGRVEFVQRGQYLSAQNLLDEWYAGGELDLRVQPLHALSVRLGLGVAKLLESEEKATVKVVGGPEVEQSLFPTVQAHLVADYVLPFWKLRVSPEISYVGARAASQSNAMQRDEAYSLPGYFFTALAISMPERALLGDRPTSLSLRLSNIVGTRYAEPGFGGVDVPAQGRTVLLTLSQGI